VASAQTYFSVDWWLATGFDRMTLHWIPLNVFYLGVTLGTKNTYHSNLRDSSLRSE
jgi:hypothetical protein